MEKYGFVSIYDWIALAVVGIPGLISVVFVIATFIVWVSGLIKAEVSYRRREREFEAEHGYKSDLHRSRFYK